MVTRQVSVPAARVFAVVVSYRCSLDKLAEQFERLLEQVQQIVWVDNGTPEDLATWLTKWPLGRVQGLWLGENRGLAHAQNRGISWALDHGATHVLLMDHDSLPGRGMVGELLVAMNAHKDAAAVGPWYADPRRTVPKSPFFNLDGWRTRWFDRAEPDQVWIVDHVIASGCLIPAAVLRAVGLMREEYFIDWVDVEWCLRARGMGYRVYGACAAELEHRLGDHLVNVLGREIPLHAPWRHYYQSRNLVFMLKSVKVGGFVKIHHAIQQLKRLLVFSTLVPGRMSYLRMWMRGLLDGALGMADRDVVPGVKRRG